MCNYIKITTGRNFLPVLKLVTRMCRLRKMLMFLCVHMTRVLFLMLKASCLTLEINDIRCYEVKIEKSEKAGSDWELNPGHLWLEPPVLCH